ncbi:hypothetical protein ABB37_05464 [Leptomonas pyrrhocoris]|uniref:Uncharacterized protein n=1 Tax=Leptomonas pyrrhocoris TaxID=157538 RepID=A0A0N0DV10_LEPPY|nr:hypothetical protein ABB37_05464 [Leptomonas pyrrhocoris]KPA79692.1 hypothetical protein ABB37_05464 [Leptomonas pyrrhocoris]|eukprot:XP_015658131.1 hypothetical protein ABB37_05464 [Leptomonas pyrrhocoris]
MIMRPTHNDDSCGRGNNSNYHSAAAAGDETAFVDLAATPEKQRRTRLASAMHEQNSHLDTPTSSSPQYVDPSTDNGANSRAGSSSLVFALSEDSELKVLASRVGPHVTVAPTNRAAPPTVLHRGGNHGASHTANQCRPAPSDLLLTSSNVTSAALADEVNGSGAYRPAPALRQLRPHTPSTHRDARGRWGGVGRDT